MELDRNSAIPISHQLHGLILSQVARGELRPGDRLPTESEFCERLGVSRTTVRKALGTLAAQGLLVRHPGRGTFISASASPTDPIAPQDLSVIVSDERWCWPLQRAAAVWNAEHAEQPLRLRFRIVELTNLRSRLALAVAEGMAPDISLVDSAWVAEFAERGYLQPLGAIDPDLKEAVAADLFPPLRRQNSFRGDLWALQAEADCSVMWYRKDWFGSEGLTPPATWAEWIERAQHFRRTSVRKRYGLGEHPLAFAAGVTAGETATYQLLPLLWAAGADVISDGQVVLNSPSACQAVEFVTDLVRKHRAASTDVTSAAWNAPPLAIAAGSVAMALGGTYESTMIRAAAGWDKATFQAKLGFVPIPAGVGGAQTTLIGGMSYAIYRQCRRPQLAFQLIARALQPEALRDFCLRTGQNPPTFSATRALADAAEPFLHATAPLLEAARPRWPLPEYARVSYQVRQMFQSAVTGDLIASQAVARAAAVISGITGAPERAGSLAAWATTERVPPVARSRGPARRSR